MSFRIIMISQIKHYLLETLNISTKLIISITFSIPRQTDVIIVIWKVTLLIIRFSFLSHLLSRTKRKWKWVLQWVKYCIEGINRDPISSKKWSIFCRPWFTIRHSKKCYARGQKMSQPKKSFDLLLVYNRSQLKEFSFLANLLSNAMLLIFFKLPYLWKNYAASFTLQQLLLFRLILSNENIKDCTYSFKTRKLNLKILLIFPTDQAKTRKDILPIKSLLTSLLLNLQIILVKHHCCKK